MASKAIVLASSSAQRKALLQQIGIDPVCVAADIDETRQPDEAVQDYVQRLAHEKCQAVLAQYPDAIVIGADTVISFAGEIYGKAADFDQTQDTLTSLSGESHSVFTGVAIATVENSEDCVCETVVDFKTLSPEQIKAYWNSGEPHGKAGSYAIQGMGAIFVRSLHGSYANVVGLPLHEVSEILKRFDVRVLA